MFLTIRCLGRADKGLVKPAPMSAFRAQEVSKCAIFASFVPNSWPRIEPTLHLFSLHMRAGSTGLNHARLARGAGAAFNRFLLPQASRFPPISAFHRRGTPRNHAASRFLQWH